MMENEMIGSAIIGRRNKETNYKNIKPNFTEEELKDVEIETKTELSARKSSTSTLRPKKKVIRCVKKGNKVVFTSEPEEPPEEERKEESPQPVEEEKPPEPPKSKSNWKNMDTEFYLRTAFGLLDRNQDGRVTANELQFMLRNLGIHVRDELIDDLMKEASHEGSGLIDETEFLQWVARIQAIREDTESSTPQDVDDDLTQDLIAAFRVFDRDGNGYITRDELQTAMDMIGETVTEQQLSEMLALADLDKDGKINYEEFARLLL